MVGCAGPGETPGIRPACQYGAGEVLPLVLRDNHPLVPVRIGGGLAQMVPDTGADSSGVTPATAARLNLRADPRRRVTIRGTGGAIQAEEATADVEFGTTRVPQLRLAVVDLPSFGASPDGLLGTDVLARHDIEFDLAGARMVLHPAAGGCEATGPPWADRRFYALPLQRRSRRFLVEVRIDGQPVRALLDSGAAGTLLTETAARRLGVTEAQLAAAPTGTRRGVDGSTRVVRRVRFAELRIGPEVLRDIPIGVGPASLGPETEMLLGLDWMRRRRLWIAYGAGRVFVGPATGPATVAAAP